MCRPRALLLLLVVLIATDGARRTLAAQNGASGAIRGVVYDSLLHAPLGGAEVWLRGTERRELTERDGRFHFDSLPAGRYTIAVSHAGLDSVGLYSVALPLTVAAGDTLHISVATQSLATLWRRRCGVELGSSPDSGLVFGVIQDATSGAHLAGAALIAKWVRLTKITDVDVQVNDRDVRVHTDSVGAYYACGVATDMTLVLRGYAGRDSTGPLDLRLGARRVARQDLTVALDRPATATLRGSARTSDGKPLLGARAIVRDAGSASLNAAGTFVVTNLPAGTQWVSVQAIGRQAAEQAVDLKSGETTMVSVALEPLPVTLDPVRVTSTRHSIALKEFDERRRLGLGYMITAADLEGVRTMRAVFTGAPSVRVERARGSLADFQILIESPGLSGQGWCLASLFIDGFRARYEQLSSFQPTDLIGVEIYQR
ncbi:MAG TPA: carboxypeptidase-like regulatory domain-containing protein, partial [Gemmatimonadales bacterium]|nr:carboxypeptidase-like regulatory domain-containing protein [Gemmatimonadales bacterium]